jgi:hypothetical protein
MVVCHPYEILNGGVDFVGDSGHASHDADNVFIVWMIDRRFRLQISE